MEQPSVPPQRKFSTEEALVGLQKELQVSLTSNRNKRDEIEQLRSELEELHKHLLSKENETERLEMLVTKQEVKCSATCIQIYYCIVFTLTLNVYLVWGT